MEDLENRSLEYVMIGEFLIDLKKEFSSENNELVKIAELKKMNQGSRTMEEFVQKFRKAARTSDKKTIDCRVQKRDEWSYLEEINGSRMFFQKY